jgi:hypothetical protein
VVDLLFYIDNIGRSSRIKIEKHLFSQQIEVTSDLVESRYRKEWNTGMYKSRLE